MSKISLFKNWSYTDIFFGAKESRIQYLKPKTSYDVVFGSLNLDLSGIELGNEPTVLVLDVVFGSATIKLPPDLPVIINSEVVFGSVKEPTGKQESFGEFSVETTDFFEQKAMLTLKVNVVFGSVEITQEGQESITRPIPIPEGQFQP